jgi:hypothetical protein
MAYISTFNQIWQLTGKSVSQFHILGAFGMAATAITNNHIDIMGRNVAAPDVTVVIIDAVKRTDTGISHWYPLS